MPAGRTLAGAAVEPTAAAARARCAELRAAGAALRARPVREIVAALDGACARWRDPADPARRDAEAALAWRYGVPERAIAVVLDAAFGRWDATAMREWLATEIGHAEALDRPVSMGAARRQAYGPALVVALSAHGVPTTPVADLLAALLVKAPVWIKPASGADDLAARFAGTLAVIDPGLGAAVETAAWPSESAAAGEILAAAEVVVATGRAESIAEIRRRIAPDARLIAHGPRLSAAIITREALADSGRVIDALADDAAFAGQTGCLSPSVAYVETDPEEAVELGLRLQPALAERWPSQPRTAVGTAERARFAEWLSLADVGRASGTVLATVGAFEDGWSVQVRAAAPPDPVPVPRVLIVSPVASAAHAAELCARRRGLVATVGVAAAEQRAEELVPALAGAGVERVAPLGDMQRPPLSWRRDGRATLSDLVRWFELSRP